MFPPCFLPLAPSFISVWGLPLALNNPPCPPRIPSVFRGVGVERRGVYPICVPALLLHLRLRFRFAYQRLFFSFRPPVPVLVSIRSVFPASPPRLPIQHLPLPICAVRHTHVAYVTTYPPTGSRFPAPLNPIHPLLYPLRRTLHAPLSIYHHHPKGRAPIQPLPVAGSAPNLS
ncbi:hypothetical protein D9758_014148 [Tetrapyrgos nigripes]|uniref:Secreted protein n=1 Tax=Tetrapyrgos nigripes TaxID=182062 RepID=A0A8H5CP66_9AGAR|nr:hypothetical protein D9758_014148 [Tetrapyrgos nigripes]